MPEPAIAPQGPAAAAAVAVGHGANPHPGPALAAELPPPGGGHPYLHPHLQYGHGLPLPHANPALYPHGHPMPVPVPPGPPHQPIFYGHHALPGPNYYPYPPYAYPGYAVPPPAAAANPPLPGVPAPQPPAEQPALPPAPTGNAAAPKTSTIIAKVRPNAEPRPGVFRFQVFVVTPERRREFSVDTDIDWDDFNDRVKAFLDDTPKPVKILYKLVGEAGKGSQLTDSKEFGEAVARLSERAMHARTRAVAMEVRNATIKASTASTKRQGGKRGRDEDIPPSTATAETNSQLKAYKQLEAELRCETHHGFCVVDRCGGRDSHRRLDYAEMTLWAKKISLGQATIYAPPNCLNFDRGANKRPRVSGVPAAPQVHVTINAIPTTGSMGYSVDIPGTPSTSTMLSRPALKDLPTQPSEDTPTVIPSSATPNSNSESTLRSQTLQTLLTSAPAHPVASAGVVSYPDVQLLLDFLDLDYPGDKFGELTEILRGIGIDDIHKVLLMPVDVLGAIGSMGLDRAQKLHHYAGYGIGLVHGLLRSVTPYGTDLATAVEDSADKPGLRSIGDGDSGSEEGDASVVEEDSESDADNSECEQGEGL